MQHYLRFYIKFQSYVVAVTTILGSIFMAYHIISDWDLSYGENHDFRYMGSTGLVIYVIWLTVGVSLFYGILKEDKRFVYPFIPMFILKLFLLIVGDIEIIWRRERCYTAVFKNLAAIPIVFYITLHVLTTLVAFGKLIEQEPMPQPGTNFVRFQPGAKDVGANEESQATQ